MAGQVGPVCLCAHGAVCVHPNVLPASVSFIWRRAAELWTRTWAREPSKETIERILKTKVARNTRLEKLEEALRRWTDEGLTEMSSSTWWKNKKKVKVRSLFKIRTFWLEKERKGSFMPKQKRTLLALAAVQGHTHCFSAGTVEFKIVKPKSFDSSWTSFWKLCNSACFNAASSFQLETNQDSSSSPLGCACSSSSGCYTLLSSSYR